MALLASSHTRPVIDLSGPAGSAYALMGQVSDFGRQLGWDKTKIKDLQSEMMSADYTNLVRVFEREFGQFVDLIVPEELEAQLVG